MQNPKPIFIAVGEDTRMFRIKAAAISRMVEVTVVGISAVFSAVFILMIVNMFSIVNTASAGSEINGISLGWIGGFFSQANVFMYVTIEALFLALVIFATWISVRRKKYTD
jgi:hypothetical protein